MSKYAYVLKLPDRPRFWLLVAFHLFGDSLMWAFQQGIEQHRSEVLTLRQQASKRDSSGRFAPKNTGQ